MGFMIMIKALSVVGLCGMKAVLFQSPMDMILSMQPL